MQYCDIFNVIPAPGGLSVQVYWEKPFTRWIALPCDAATRDKIMGLILFEMTRDPGLVPIRELATQKDKT